jgi:cytochrome c peroxidase
MQLRGIDTDPERLWTWKKADAVAANGKVSAFGIERPGLVEDDLIGYNPPFLDGLWLRAPYLHNGSVPTLRDLLKSPAQRPTVFWRGYDVYDPGSVGFVADGERARLVGSKFDVNERSNGNGGHLFGTTLPDTDKESLLEYLKTL